jgi:hypothetical protein
VTPRQRRSVVDEETGLEVLSCDQDNATPVAEFERFDSCVDELSGAHGPERAPAAGGPEPIKGDEDLRSDRLPRAAAGETDSPSETFIR